MKALVLNKIKSPLEVEQRQDLQPNPDEVVIRLHAAALNRRDYWVTQGMYPGIKLPIVLGSDGVGVVVGQGRGVAREFGDREVIINPGWQWGEQQSAQANEFEILGMPHDGTLAEQVVVSAQYVHPKPEHLTVAQAAALPLAGVTAYRALFSRGNLQPGENVLVTGVGGGVATFLVQFASAVGANVFVTSSSQEKIEKAIGLGATAGYDYTQPDWHKKLLSDVAPMNLTVDGAGGAGYANLIDLAAPAGRIVNYGSTAGAPNRLDLFQVFWKQLNLLGTTMGSDLDFADMLNFVSQHRIEPMIDAILPWGDANQAFEKLQTSRQFGKIVLEI